MLKTRILTVLVLLLGFAAPSHAYFEEMLKEFENKWVVQIGMLREVVVGVTLDLEARLKDPNLQTPQALAKWFDQIREDFKKRSDNALTGVNESKLPNCVKKFFVKILETYVEKIEMLRKRLEFQQASHESVASQTGPSL